MGDHLDTRKNYRFPAFDDSEGVKLSTRDERVLFADEFGDFPGSNKAQAEEITEDATVDLVKQERVSQLPELPRQSEVKIYEPKQPEPLKRPDYSFHNPAQREKLTQDIQGQEKYRPTSSAIKLDAKENPIEARKNIFKSDHRASLEKKLDQEKRNDKYQEKNSISAKYNGRNYFVPKHIPPSIANSMEEDEQEYSREEIIARMKKPKNSYLILAEDEERPFQHDEITKKEIVDFGIHQAEAETPFLRRELNQSKREDESELPAITRKRGEQKENSEPRNGRLEKSLSGIMEAEQTHSENNIYFN